MSKSPTIGPRARRLTAATVAAVAVVVAVLAAAAPASAEFEIVDGSFEAEVFDRDGAIETQAGGRPHSQTTTFEVTRRPTGTVSGYVRNADVTLPPGFVGNPQATPKCSKVEFSALTLGMGRCPLAAQVGLAHIVTPLDFPGLGVFEGQEFAPVFNLEPIPGVAATFGFIVGPVPIVLTAKLANDGQYRIVASGKDLSQGVPVAKSTITLWSDPADPSHDANRGYTPDDGRVCARANFDSPGSCSNSIPPGMMPRVPFLSNSTSCSGPQTALIKADSWEDSGDFKFASYTNEVGMEGCDRLDFDPSMSVDLNSPVSDGPSGLTVDLRVPQNQDPDGLATAHLRKAEVTLPEGVSINPAAAGGLEACTDEQIGWGSDSPVGCPESSKIGSVTATTPVLAETLEGSVFVGSQKSFDPASGDMFRVFMVLENAERGVRVKLAGKVFVDPVTGRIRTVFDDNPQVPADRIILRLKGGPRAPLAMPTDCGTKTTDIRLTSWAGHDVALTDSVTVPCPGSNGFAPAFDAGSVSPTGGAFSPFVALIDRPQGQQQISRVDGVAPKGLVAKLKGVELCPETVAGEGTPGTCPAGSRIGTATVGAGSGTPFRIAAPVYLTGPYNGGPYGAAVHVHAKAGPFDLGMVKVRNALRVDRSSAQVSVISDRLPQIVKGVPVRLRSIDLDVDRPNFTINPTSCSSKRVEATFTSVSGAVSEAGLRFEAGDCQALPFKPRLAMRLTGKRQRTTGKHPGVRAVVRQTGVGEAGVEAAKVTLPKSLALDPDNAQALCEFADGTRPDLDDHCPKGSIVGRARAVTPLLNRPLVGDVYFVKNVERHPKTGNLIRKLPMIVVALRGDIAINLTGKSSTAKDGRLINTFNGVPDAPISRFNLNIKGGRNGILAVTRTRRARINLCKRPKSHRAVADMDGHNGKRANYRVRVKTPCGKAAKKPKRTNKKR